MSERPYVKSEYERYLGLGSHVKLRTSGRTHYCLGVLSDEDLHRAKDFAPTIEFSMGHIQGLLVYGLIKKDKALYKITELGQKAYQALEARQKLELTKTPRSRTREVKGPHKYNTFSIERGYKLVSVEIQPNRHWIEYFRTRAW